MLYFFFCPDNIYIDVLAQKNLKYFQKTWKFPRRVKVIRLYVVGR